jgi:hypothetical protein
MARIKQDPSIPNLSGKIGGQSIARTQRVAYIRNITQTNTSPTLKQSKQRFTTAHLTTLYGTLAPGDVTLWSNASLDYEKINRKGETITRNGFQTYLFINQNNILLNVSIEAKPPAYIVVNTPTIIIDSDLTGKLIISSAVVGWTQTYLVFAQPYLGGGETMNFGKGVIVGQITQAQLEAEIDILPMIENTFQALENEMTIGFYLSALVTNNGNRDQFPNMYQAEVQTSVVPLSVDILSYYPLVANTQDYFGNNNGTAVGSSLTSSGFVDGGIQFQTAVTSLFSVGDDTSLDFWDGTEVGDHSYCFWIKADSFAGFVVPFGKARNGGNRVGELCRYNPTDVLQYTAFGGVFSISRSQNATDGTLLGSWQFVVCNYFKGGVTSVFLNDVQINTTVINGTYVGLIPNSVDLWFGSWRGNQNNRFNGIMSEITILNQTLTYDEAMQIREANINGQTILDINT